jgi:1,2-diacylglycerol 3-beta-galactosyltransferase
MIEKGDKKKRIVILFSDTGGGHRSAAEAIIESLELEYPDRFEYDMVDFFKEYSPPPFNYAGPMYPRMSRIESLWELTFKFSDDPDFMRVTYASFWPYIRLGMYKLLREHPGDLYVSVHPLINIPFLRAMRRRDNTTPYMIVVTDLVSSHTAWFAKEADLIVIPTEQARKHAERAGVEDSKLRLIGLPVADRFCQPVGDKNELRQKLGWPLDKPIILLVGGGEGMGPLNNIAETINKAKFNAGMVVVTGRNTSLQEKLRAIKWNMPVEIYGFVTEMPDFMRAADILLTKAGPGTICEGLIANLPIILYHHLPGQEEGNVTYVTDEGAGVWAPEIDDIISTLREWIDHPKSRSQAAENAKRLAKPHAARDIARTISEMLGNN